MTYSRSTLPIINAIGIENTNNMKAMPHNPESVYAAINSFISIKPKKQAIINAT